MTESHACRFCSRQYPPIFPSAFELARHMQTKHAAQIAEELTDSLRNLSPELVHAIDGSTLAPTATAHERLATFRRLLDANTATTTTTTTTPTSALAVRLLQDRQLFPVGRDPTNAIWTRACADIGPIDHTNAFTHTQTIAWLRARPTLPATCTATAALVVRTFAVSDAPLIMMSRALMNQYIGLAWTTHHAYADANEPCPFEPIPVEAFSKVTWRDARSIARMVQLCNT